MTAARSGRVAAVVFDLDGVLVDSEIWWDDARRAWAAEHERAWTEADRRAVMGANGREWSRTMRDRLGVDRDPEAIEAEVVARVVARYRDEGPPRIDGVVEAVEAVAERVPVAVASSAHRDVIEAAVGGLGLRDRFAVIVSSDEVAHGKPAPDVYLEAARRLRVTPADVLVVEDSYNGVLAAKAAGMTAVLVPNATIPPAPGTAGAADVVLDSIRQLKPDALGIGAPDPPRPRPGRMSRSGRSTIAQPLRRGLRSRIRYRITRVVSTILVRVLFRLRVEGVDRLPVGGALLCFNHLSWADPFVAMAGLPWDPRLSFFGPKEEDMRRGARNRLMTWTGTAIPYRPSRDDLLEATRRVGRVLGSGEWLAIAGEGRIHIGESALLPLSDGPAFFALRFGVPIVPLAINGTSWLGLGRRVRVRIGEPIEPAGSSRRADVDALTVAVDMALRALVADAPEPPPPGRFGRWLTERFNEWPEGGRPPAPEASESAASDRGPRS